MPLTEVELADAVEVVRVIARAPSQLRKSLVVHQGYFARREHMSGISLWLAGSRVEAINAWTTKWPKGTLICTVGTLRTLGLRFFQTNTDGHFTVRCGGCDLSPNQMQGQLCARTDRSNCGFFLNPELEEGKVAEIGLLDRLVNAFRLDLPITHQNG